MNTDFSTLANSLHGNLILPNDPEYDTARAVYNGMHDRRPAAIAQVADKNDVVAVINFARENKLLLAVRGGGHSVPGFGTCDDGLVLDLGNMNDVTIDAENSIAHVQGGCTLGQMDQATHKHGLAIPGGTVSTTGVAGLTLGGGMGHLSRSCGLSCDNLLSVEVVTADGKTLTCGSEQNSDLFWAIRGGGGNFGVVTEFTFKAYPVKTVFGGPTMFRIDEEVMHHYEDLIRRMPAHYNALFAIALAPPAPFIPEEWHLKPVMIILSCWSGDESLDEAILHEVSKKGEIVGQALWRMPYPEINMFFDELLPAGLRQYWKANAFMSFTPESIAAHIEHGPGVPNIESGIFIFPINGACHQPGEEDTAFASRHTNMSSVIAGAWHESKDDEANVRWVKAYFEALEPYSEAGAYVNFLDNEDPTQAISSYGKKLERLTAIKRQYDPDNLFRVNQNIAP